MNKTHYEPGDQVDALCTAGAAFDQYEQDGIAASVFPHATGYLVPMIQSATPGSGNLSAFLAALRVALPDHPIRFVNVINGRLRARLEREGFDVVSDDEMESMV